MKNQEPKPLSILWVYPGDLSAALDKATWLSTTRVLRSFGCRVSLLSIGDENCKTIEGVDVQCLSAPNVYFIGKLIFHLKVMACIFQEKKQLDIILFHPPSGLFFLPLIFIRWLLHLPRLLFVVDIRTIYMVSRAETNWRMEIRRVYFSFIQWMFNHLVDGQTAITQRLANYYHIPSNKLWGIWQSGVDLEKFQPCNERRDWSQIDECIHLIYIGTLDDGRNVGVFCQAVIKRAQVGERFSFTVVGNGHEQQSIIHLANMHPSILHYHLPVPHQEIPSWLAEAHLGVLPFPNEVKFQVSSPIKLFEYMAAGLPLLATRIVCHTDFIRDSEFVFWAEDSTVEHFEAALQKVWEKRKNLPDLSKKAAAEAQAWSWEKSANKLYQALLQGLSS